MERSAHGTAVIFALRELGPQTITFSYEGLVEPQLHEAVLGRDQLWLPEFTAPVEEWTVVLQLQKNGKWLREKWCNLMPKVPSS